MEILVSAGLFRDLGTKAELLMKVEKIWWSAKKSVSTAGSTGQLTLFEDENFREPDNTRHLYSNPAEDGEFLEIIVSDKNETFKQIDRYNNIKARGFITRYRGIRTRNKKKMAFFTLENHKFVYECVMFPRIYSRQKNKLYNRADYPVTVFGKLETKTGLPKIIVKKIL